MDAFAGASPPILALRDVDRVCGGLMAAASMSETVPTLFSLRPFLVHPYAVKA